MTGKVNNLESSKAMSNRKNKRDELKAMKGCSIGCITLLILSLIIGGCMALFEPEKITRVDLTATKEEQFEQAKKLYTTAWVMALNFIKKNLKSPSSAKFGSYTDKSVIWWKGNEFICTVNVDSQNGFGAMVRSTWIVKVECLGDDNWRLLEINQVK